MNVELNTIGCRLKTAIAIAVLSAMVGTGSAASGFWTPVLGQTGHPIAMESSQTTTGRSAEGISDELSVEVKRVPQPAFGWAVSDWKAIEPVRREAKEYEGNGYFVRIIPNKGLTEFRVTIGHYRSEKEARDFEIGLPMPVRTAAEIIPIERYVVFTQSGQSELSSGSRSASDSASDSASNSGSSSRSYPGSSSGASTGPRSGSSSQSDSGSSSGSGVRADAGSGLPPDSSGPEAVGDDAIDQRQRVQSIPGPLLQPFEVRFAMSTIFDSNIDHSQEDRTRALGLVPALMLRYRSTPRNPLFVISYGIARHRYSETEKWDRTSHLLLARFEPRMGGAFRMETDLNLTSNGSFEDRDLSDQIEAVQSFEYRFTRDYRLHAYGTLRWKYPKLNDDDAFKPNVGMIFEQKLEDDRTWEMGARYEVNLEEIERGNYTRWTFEMEYEIELSEQTELEFGIKHRRKNYWKKEVEIEDEDFPRRDTRWILGASLDHEIMRNVFTNVRYQFEGRSSNDPEKPFDAHLLDFGVYVLL